MNAIAPNFGHRRGASQFILSLLFVGGPLATSLSLFMPLRLGNTHFLLFISPNLKNKNGNGGEWVKKMQLWVHSRDNVNCQWLYAT